MMLLSHNHAHFNPATAGAVLSLDARFLPLANNDAVADWTARPNSTITATQGTAAAKPTFKTGIVNGQPAVRFDGDDSLAVSTLGSPSGMTGIIVFKNDNNPPVGTISDGGGIWCFSTSLYNSHMTWSDGFVQETFGTDTRKEYIFYPGSVNNSFSIYGVVSASNDYRVYQNGYREYTTASNVVAVGASPTIGVSRDGYHLLGYVAAVVIATSAVSDALRRRIEQSLAFSFRIACA